MWRGQAMADQGSGGAFEISQRMTAMLGWGATTSFQEDWTWDQAAETYALDPEMADKLRKNNPQVGHSPPRPFFVPFPSLAPRSVCPHGDHLHVSNPNVRCEYRPNGKPHLSCSVLLRPHACITL